MERTRTTKQHFGIPDIRIPFEVLFNPALSNTEKMLYGFITNLAHGERGCYATNLWLGGLLGIKLQTVSKAITNLKEWGLILIEHTTQDNRETRHIFLNPEYHNIYHTMVSNGYKNIDRGVVEKSYPPIIKMIGKYYSNRIILKEDSKISARIRARGIILENISNEWKDNPEFMEALNSHLTHRSQKRQTPTQEAAKQMGRKLSKCSVEVATKSLEESTSNNWIGVFPKEDNYSPKKSTSKQSKPLPKKSPTEIITQHFPGSYRVSFQQYYDTAQSFLTNQNPEDDLELAKNMCSLYGVINDNQNSEDPVIPTPGILIRDYSIWLEDQDWLDEIAPLHFEFENRVFKRFLSKQSKALGVHPIYGKKQFA